MLYCFYIMVLNLSRGRKRENVLKESYRVLKKNGILFITTQSIFNLKTLSLYIRKILNSISNKMTERLWVHQERTNFVVKITNPIRLLRLLKKIGFNLEYINSRNRMERNKDSSLCSIWTKRRLFYISRKKEITCEDQCH